MRETAEVRVVVAGAELVRPASSFLFPWVKRHGVSIVSVMMKTRSP